MRFSGKEIPGSMFAAARDFMLVRTAGSTFTPDQVRAHLQIACQAELAALSDIAVNRRIVAERVYQEVRAQLVSNKDIAQVKRGLWAKS